ncbi:hypothetical protein QJS10_CPA16g01275 [Acorus calamus]|uniref:Uncharacterized protein n=1 Tax=Acorus calamus TaxID=4465 RepID=A0AAV9CY25_ACOCL|nr:hypothetical protein QJS10_CPA16g01275 [Acorus calamus]
MISCRPELLSFNPDKTIKPKMDFLRDAGFSTPDLIFILSKNSSILTCSLDNLIAPAYGFLKGILGTGEVVVLAAKRSPWLLHNDLHKTMGSKIDALRGPRSTRF